MKRLLFVSALLAAAASFAAIVTKATFGDLGLDAQVVTNVTFDGFLTEHQDISGKADSTNVYTKAEADARIVELPAIMEMKSQISSITNILNGLEAALQVINTGSSQGGNQ
ncbi:MAG: hypothetical protein IKE55_11010 [Kiritimatiellae bacterium]|nr:hypothetical protein [Kiritimatiellia bacterium]